jgi:hypothetical protein
MLSTIRFIIFSLATALSSYAQDYGGSSCPESSFQVLEVVNFVDSQSADSRSTIGSCKVLVSEYKWWETMTSRRTFKKEITTKCSKNDLFTMDESIFAKAYVSYDLMIDSCRSNPGCQYTCSPKVLIRL